MQRLLVPVIGASGNKNIIISPSRTIITTTKQRSGGKSLLSLLLKNIFPTIATTTSSTTTFTYTSGIFCQQNNNNRKKHFQQHHRRQYYNLGTATTSRSFLNNNSQQRSTGLKMASSLSTISEGPTDQNKNDDNNKNNNDNNTSTNISNNKRKLELVDEKKSITEENRKCQQKEEGKETTTETTDVDVSQQKKKKKNKMKKWYEKRRQKKNNKNISKKYDADGNLKKGMVEWNNRNNETTTTTTTDSGSERKIYPKPLPHEGSFAHVTMRQMYPNYVEDIHGFDDNDNDNDDTNNKAADDNEDENKPTNSDNDNINANTKTKKRKVAMLIGFLGNKYAGFQINPEKLTIQSLIELALYKNNNIVKTNFGYPKKYAWSTSGRTDKGVHASGQLISCKINIPIPITCDDNSQNNDDNNDDDDDNNDDDDINEQLILDEERKKINTYLPPDIQILDIKRVVKGFCAHTQRDKVIYTYMIPSFVFYPRSELRSEVFEKLLLSPEQVKQDNTDYKTTKKTSIEEIIINNRDKSDPLSNDEIQRILKDSSSENNNNNINLLSYRITSKQKQDLNDILNEYVGTQSYHNLTKGMALPKPSKGNNAPGDKQNERYIVSFDVIDTKVYNIGDECNGSNDNDGIEWITTRVVGQSFLYNQIRKMICLAIDIVRGATTTTTDVKDNDTNVNYDIDSIDMKRKFIQYVIRKDKPTSCRISIAPAEGLFLDMSMFNSYNRRYVQNKRKNASSDVGMLDWTTNETANNGDNNNNNNNDKKETSAETTNTESTAIDRYKKFKEDIIMKQIIKQELNEGNFIKYLFQQEYVWEFHHYDNINHNILKEIKAENEEERMKDESIVET